VFAIDVEKFRKLGLAFGIRESKLGRRGEEVEN